MRCTKEEFVEGAIFHIYNHAVDGIDLFYEHDDYLYFLKKLKKNYSPDELAIYAYCLMPNHFHFCLKQKSDRPIYNVFNRLIISYVHHYNSIYKRWGRLFANKLQHKRISTEQYLVDICPYIHLNPLTGGLVEHLEDWEYSNYPEWIGIRAGQLFDSELLTKYFDNSDAYKKYVETLIEDKMDEIEKYLFTTKP